MVDQSHIYNFLLLKLSYRTHFSPLVMILYKKFILLHLVSKMQCHVDFSLLFRTKLVRKSIVNEFFPAYVSEWKLIAELFLIVTKDHFEFERNFHLSCSSSSSFFLDARMFFINKTKIITPKFLILLFTSFMRYLFPNTFFQN